LGREHLAGIVTIQLKRVGKLLAEKGYQMEISQPALDYLAEVGYDPDFGARPLKRAVQRELQDPLAMKILAGEFKEGDQIQVDRDAKGLTFKSGKPAE